MKKNVKNWIAAGLLFFSLSANADSTAVNPSASMPQQNAPSTSNAGLSKNSAATPDLADATINMILIESTVIKSGINGKIRKTARLSDSLLMYVKNLDLLLLKRTLDNPIVLYINNIPFKTIIGRRNIKKHDELVFVLDRTTADNDNWNKVLRSGLLKKSFDLNVGLLDKSLISNNVAGITFYLRSTAELIPFLLLVGIVLALTCYLIFKKGLLQVTVSGVTSYSISSIHLFFWTFIILTSYIIIWWCCDDINSIDSSNLILLGISAATTGAGVIINGSQNAAANTLSAGSVKSGSFIMDLFSQNNVVSIDRYQLVMFNLVVGVFFIFRVLSELTMPVLDSTLLTLLGISSLTYASVKAVKNTGTPAPAPQPSDTPPTPPTPPGN